MKRNLLLRANETSRESQTRRLNLDHQFPHRTFFVFWILPLLLLARPVVVNAQFAFITNNGAITITGYTGPGGDLTIPSTINGLPVASIGSGAFDHKTNLTSITIPDSVVYIESSAFYFCWNLTNLSIGSSVINIGDHAFAFCGGLTNITIPGSVTNIADYCFSYCSSLSKILFPNTSINIGAYAFASCISLTNMTISSGVTGIGSHAFDSCGLTNATIPSNVTNIGSGPFAACRYLMALTVDALNPVYSSIAGVLFNKDQTILIQFPGRKAGDYPIPNSVTSIGDSAFEDCYFLTGITTPNILTSIGSYAFYDCFYLTTITLPNGVTNIGAFAFAQSGLSSITIPNSLIHIGNLAFIFCYSLTSVTIPDNVTSIGDLAFYNCATLTNITIPASVTNMGDYCFSCPSLTGIYFKGNAPNVNLSTFDAANNSTVYYLPGTTGWDTTFAGRPTVLWNPRAQTGDGSFGIKANQFGFMIIGATGLVIVVEACTNLANPTWLPVSTNTLNGGSSYFSDPQWTNHPGRFYRLRSP